jgi:hypothetical protein
MPKLKPSEKQLELQSKIEKIQKEREELFAKKEPIDRRLVATSKLINRYQEQIVKLQIEEEGGITTPLMLSRDGLNSTAVHKARFKWAFDNDLYASGYWPDTDQSAFKIMLRYQRPIDTALKAINELLPHYKPQKDGKVWFEIFDHGLNEQYSFMLKARPDGSGAEIFRQRGSEKVIKSGSLADCLTYIAKYLYYGEKSESEEEKEDPYQHYEN